MLKWIGKEKGLAGIPGIPGRDLSEKEIDERGLDRKLLLETGLYIEDKPAKSKKEEKREV